MRADLDKRVEAVVQHGIQRVGQQNWMTHVVVPVLRVQVRAALALAGYGRVQRRRGLDALCRGQGLQHHLLDRLHVVAVVRHLDLNRALKHAPRLQDLSDPLQRLRVARQGQHLRTVHGGDGDPAFLARDQPAGFVQSQPDGQHAASARDLVLGLRTMIDHLDRLLQRQGPGRERRGDFADGMPDHGRGADSVVRVQSRQRDLDGQDRGLDDQCFVDPGFRLGLGQFCQQGPAGELLEQAVDFFQRVAKDGLALQPLLAHAGPLAALTGEDERQLRVLLAGDRGRENRRLDLPVGEFPQLALDVLRGLPDHGHQIRKMAAARKCREGGVGQVFGRAVQQVGMPQGQHPQRVLLGRTQHIHRRTRGRLTAGR